MSKPLSKFAQAMVAVGQEVYGDRWKSPLAKRLGVSPSYIRLIVSGGKAPTEDIFTEFRNLVEGLIEEEEVRHEQKMEVLRRMSHENNYR